MAKFSENHQIAEGTAFSHCGFFSMLFLCGGRGEEITHREDVEENRKKDGVSDNIFGDYILTERKLGEGGYSSIHRFSRVQGNQIT